MADDYLSWLKSCIQGAEPNEQASNLQLRAAQAKARSVAQCRVPQVQTVRLPQPSEPQSKPVSTPPFSEPQEWRLSTEQNGESEARVTKPEEHRVRLVWDEPRDTFLLEFLIASSPLAKWNGALPMHVWEELRDRFNTKFKDCISVFQLRCRKDNLKRMHSMVQRLRKREDMEWNPQQLRFFASDELWDHLCHADRRVAKVANKRVHWFPAADELFRGHAARRQAARKNRDMTLLEGTLKQQEREARRKLPPEEDGGERPSEKAAEDGGRARKNRDMTLLESQPQQIQPKVAAAQEKSLDTASLQKTSLLLAPKIHPFLKKAHEAQVAIVTAPAGHTSGGNLGVQMASLLRVSLPQDPMEGLDELRQQQEREVRRKLPSEEDDGERPSKKAKAAEDGGIAAEDGGIAADRPAKEGEGTAEDPVLKTLRLVQEEDLTDEEKIQCIDFILADDKVAAIFHALQGSQRIHWLRQRLKAAS